MEMYVVCKNSKTGNPYQSLGVDLGYRTCTLSFDRSIISEITGISLQKLATMPVDTKVKVGEVIIKEVNQ